LNKEAFDRMKKGVMVINTSRGGLVDSEALLEAIMSGKVGAAGLDVYEGKQHLFMYLKQEY
jgi:D-lactate dehydrogenase